MELINFYEAQSEFKNLLVREGRSSNLLWLFREDVIFLFARVFVRIPVPAENETRMAACYELGKKRGFGLNLHGFCLLDSQLCCYVVLPKDDLDSQYMLMAPNAIKYSFRDELPEAESVRNPVLWKFRAWQSKQARFSHFDDHMPSRASLLPELSQPTQ